MINIPNWQSDVWANADGRLQTVIICRWMNQSVVIIIKTSKHNNSYQRI